MPVIDFECQLARSQITRYMGGEALSQESLRQLGLHVTECSGCKDFLESRREALKNMVESDASEKLTKAHEAYERSQSSLKSATKSKRRDATEPAVTHAVVEEKPLTAAEKLISQIKGKLAEQKVDISSESDNRSVVAGAKPIKSFSKSLYLSGILAVVLIGMSYFVKSPDHLFGPKALTAEALSPNSNSIAPSTNTDSMASTIKQPKANGPANVLPANPGPEVNVQTTKPNTQKQQTNKETGSTALVDTHQAKENPSATGIKKAPTNLAGKAKSTHPAPKKHTFLAGKSHRKAATHRSRKTNSKRGGGYIRVYAP